MSSRAKRGIWFSRDKEGPDSSACGLGMTSSWNETRMMNPRLLVANRGEIAIRIFRACRDLGIETVAVFSDADRAARHVAMADYAVRLGPPPSRESYLSVERILDAARKTKATLIHPGYGFLAESAAFARACGEAGLASSARRRRRSRRWGRRRRAASSWNARAFRSSRERRPPRGTRRSSAEFAGRVGYPILLKASAGGGGKGMRRVDREEDLAAVVRPRGSGGAGVFRGPGPLRGKAHREPAAHRGPDRRRTATETGSLSASASAASSGATRRWSRSVRLRPSART